MASWSYSARHGAWYLGGRGCTAKVLDGGAWTVRDEQDRVVVEGTVESTGGDVEAAKAAAAAAHASLTAVSTVARPPPLE